MGCRINANMRGGERPLLNLDEFSLENLSTSNSGLTRKTVMRLAAESQRDKALKLNRRHQRDLENIKVFTNLSEYFEHTETVGASLNPIEKFWLQFQLVFAPGFSSKIWNNQLGSWQPVVYLRPYKFLPKRMLASYLLHELRHAVDEVLDPSTEKDAKKYREIVNAMFLGMAIASGSVLGIAVLGQSGREFPRELLASGLIGTMSTLINLGRYYFDPHERRARASSKRVR